MSTFQWIVAIELGVVAVAQAIPILRGLLRSS